MKFILLIDYLKFIYEILNDRYDSNEMYAHNIYYY